MVRRKSEETKKSNQATSSGATSSKDAAVIERQKQAKEKQTLISNTKQIKKPPLATRQEESDEEDGNNSSVSSVSSVSSSEESDDDLATNKPKKPVSKTTPKKANAPQPEAQVLSSTRNDAVATTKPVNKRKSTVPKRKTRVFGEIRRMQNSTRNCIPRAPFLRLVKELIVDRCGKQMRVTEMAVEALREASEMIITNIFEDSNLLAIHAKRVTLMAKDMQLLLKLKHQDFYPIRQ